MKLLRNRRSVLHLPLKSPKNPISPKNPWIFIRELPFFLQHGVPHETTTRKCKNDWMSPLVYILWSLWIQPCWQVTSDHLILTLEVNGTHSKVTIAYRGWREVSVNHLHTFPTLQNRSNSQKSRTHISRYTWLAHSPNVWTRCSGLPALGTAVAAPIRKLWEEFPFEKIQPLLIFS